LSWLWGVSWFLEFVVQKKTGVLSNPRLRTMTGNIRPLFRKMPVAEFQPKTPISSQIQAKICQIRPFSLISASSISSETAPVMIAAETTFRLQGIAPGGGNKTAQGDPWAVLIREANGLIRL
jgi:hypothetical protein